MEAERLRGILESLLLAAGEPVSLTRLGNALEDVPRETIKQELTAMAADYGREGRGFALEEIAGGYQLRTVKAHAPYVRRLLSAKPPRLSRPLLETLAIVAYRPQVTRPEIELLRGVDTGGVLETLLERGLIRIAGRKEVAGRPLIYETTPGFLELFGLKNIDALPDLEELRAIEETLAETVTSLEPENGTAEGPSMDLTPAANHGDADIVAAEPIIEQINEASSEPPDASIGDRKS